MLEAGERGWTAPALAVFERACESHGGLEAWRRLNTLRLFPEQLSGLVPWLKGNGRTFRLPGVFEIRPHQRWVRFAGYPDDEHAGIFENGSVRLERADGSGVVTKSNEHRQTFRGLAAYRRWTPLDALYFFGYALTHYHTLPFSFIDARLIGAREAGAGSERQTILDLELPADLPTHCRRQRVYFDASARLVRHDYHAEIVSFMARGAHFWRRQVSIGGLSISMERRVLLRLGSLACPLTALHATFRDAEVELARSGT